MSNIERFNALLNSCQNPRAMHNALLALAQSGALEELMKEYTTHEGRDHKAAGQAG